MKTQLIALTTLLSTLSAPAFAFTAEQAAKVMSNEKVQETLDGQSIDSIKNGPSYRCRGCYALVITTRPYDEESAPQVYNVQVMDLDGHFSVNIAKIKTGN